MGKVVDIKELKLIREDFRKQNKKVVFTNGCFDLIHRGHVDYLLKSKAYGDVLIVGINTDSSINNIKGDKRPIIPLEDRAFILANLSPVDFVCPFDEETPLLLIKTIIPDVLVKGADWEINNIVGKEIVEAAGGKVETIEFVPNRSTSSLIEQILKRYT